ncbi:MAG: hypothetical protein IT323_13510 [Anaerolineae bacterium]|nr:hypothetical protein [Anaerolineae bacterium]
MTTNDVQTLQRQIKEVNRLVKQQSKQIKLLNRLMLKLVRTSTPQEPVRVDAETPLALSLVQEVARERCDD